MTIINCDDCKEYDKGVQQLQAELEAKDKEIKQLKAEPNKSKRRSCQHCGTTEREWVTPDCCKMCDERVNQTH